MGVLMPSCWDTGKGSGVLVPLSNIMPWTPVGRRVSERGVRSKTKMFKGTLRRWF